MKCWTTFQTMTDVLKYLNQKYNQYIDIYEESKLKPLSDIVKLIWDRDETKRDKLVLKSPTMLQKDKILFFGSLIIFEKIDINEVFTKQTRYIHYPISSILNYAIHFGENELILFLLDHGANPNLVCDVFDGYASISIGQHYKDIVSFKVYLLKSNKNFDIKVAFALAKYIDINHIYHYDDCQKHDTIKHSRSYWDDIKSIQELKIMICEEYEKIDS